MGLFRGDLVGKCPRLLVVVRRFRARFLGAEGPPGVHMERSHNLTSGLADDGGSPVLGLLLTNSVVG